MHGTLEFHLLKGPDDPIVQRMYAIDEDSSIGRAMSSEICLPDPSVSRRHASLLIRQGIWYLVDHGSTSGTFLNHQRLEQATPAQIRDGDRIGLGPWVFRVGEPETITRTIDLSRDEDALVVDQPISSRRLDALGGYLGAIGHARSTEDIAVCTIEAALAGTGFNRGAVLLPPSAGDEPTAFVAGRLRGPEGALSDLKPTDFHASSKLVSKALSGRTARFSAPDAQSTIDHSRSLMEHSIDSALCVPVRQGETIEALLYLDSKSDRAGIADAVGYCEDICALYAYALSHRANSELAQRQQAMRIEFEHAKELRAMLTAPAHAGSSCFRHAHRSVPGMFVSADFFDILSCADGSVQIIFGDATGHGLGASILSTLVHAHLVALLRSGMVISDAVRSTNRFISEKATAGRFVSLVVAHITADGQASIIDAGHGHWVHASSDGLFCPSQAMDVPIGIDPNAAFSIAVRSFASGDRLVLYTDGITEQENQDGEAFEHDRLCVSLDDSESCQRDVERVFDALSVHAQGRPIEDDATIASIQYLPRD